jgi:tRNA pseudouridine55 synthase
VDKPAGITSHDVVARARRRLGTRAIGHLGTLDPAATGLLVLVVGAATRCAAVWQGGAKTYAGVARFGVVTDSQDLGGRVLAEQPVAALDEARVRALAAQHLTGELRQLPPMVSALKHQGQRLHALARAGVEVERAPRVVTVHGWHWTGFAAREAAFEVKCSGGTYVRTLVHDLGAHYGTGAVLATLRRLASEPFTVAAAAPWAELCEAPGEVVLARHGIALDAALSVLPSVTVDDAGAEGLGRGQRVPVVAADDAPVDAGARSVVVRSPAGRALALAALERAPAGGLLVQPAVVFPWAVREGART